MSEPRTFRVYIKGAAHALQIIADQVDPESGDIVFRSGQVRVAVFRESELIGYADEAAIPQKEMAGKWNEAAAKRGAR